MDARTQHQLSAAEIEVILCVTRTGTLAGAGARLGLDDSTVSRTLRRIEKGLGQRLFERSRTGVRPTDLALQLARHGGRMEMELEAARALVHSPGGEVSGSIHITTTDAIASGLLLPAIGPLARLHPKLEFIVNTGNELLSLSKRDADLALRAAKEAPEHLVGKNIGLIQFALYCDENYAPPANEADWRWIAVDDALPQHPSVLWRRQAHPAARPSVRVNTIVAVADALLCGLGVGVLPQFLAARHPQLRRLEMVPERFASRLWLLMAPESRYLHRTATVYQYLSANLRLDSIGGVADP